MPEELLDLARNLAGQAGPGEELEVYLMRGSTTAVRAYNGGVEEFTSADTSGVGIRVFADGRLGMAWAGTLDEGVLRETLDEARSNVAFGEPDEWNGLAEPDGVAAPDVDLFRAELQSFPAEQKIALAVELERLVNAGDPRIKGVRSASYSDNVGERAVASSLGIAAWGRASSCSVSASALAEQDGETTVGGGFSFGRAPSDLDVEAAATEAVGKATGLLGAVKPDSARLTVVLDPLNTVQFLGIIGGTLSGMSVLKGRSLFAERLGQDVAAGALTLVDDPTNPESFGGLPHDDEGLASRRNVLIDGGRLEQFVHDSYTGRRSGSGSTASATRGYRTSPSPGCRGLFLEPGARSQSDLIASIDDGLLVQSMSGLHSGVNPVSGDFSVGVEGYRIRNGALAEPVRGLTMASTLQRMLLDVIEVGGDVRWFGASAGVSVAIGGVAVGGT